MPGYPLFIELSRLLLPLGLTPFQAARLVGAAGGLLAVLGTRYLLLSFGIAEATAAFAALLYALIPAVWLHGVRPLTDEPAAAAFLFSAGLFVRARRRESPSQYVAAVFIAALCAGIRPQAGIALVPLAAYSVYPFLRNRGFVRLLSLSAAAYLLTSAVIWAPAIKGSGGWTSFRTRMKEQAEYVRDSDGLKARELVQSRVLIRWWRDPVGATGLLAALLLLSSLALFTHSRTAATILALFAPLVVLTMAFSSIEAAPRYATIFLPLLAALAALGLCGLSLRLGRWPAAGLGVGLVGTCAVVGFPGILLVARQASPPVAVVTALRNDPEFRGRAIAFNGRLLVHMDALDAAVTRREFDNDDVVALGAGELVATLDHPLFGSEPVRKFRFEIPNLRRFSGIRGMRADIYSNSGVGIVKPRFEGNARWADANGSITLETGGLFGIDGRNGPVTMKFGARSASPNPALVSIETLGARQEVRLEPGAQQRLEFEGLPDGTGSLIRIRGLSGIATLFDFHLSAPESTMLVPRYDSTIPCAVDEPVANTSVAIPLTVRGWCQELGGAFVRPAEFRIDGIRFVPSVRRSPRPDVAAAVAGIGDCAEAGYEATFTGIDLPEGAHQLTVTFMTKDGRTRLFPARTFQVARPTADRKR